MIVGIILAGGSGKRLWPLSRDSRPKQLLSLLTEKTLLEDSVDRLSPVVDELYVSTGKKLEAQIRSILPGAKMIVEPSSRDTAAGIGLCAIQFDAEDVLVFVPSDHFIAPVDRFRSVIGRAVGLAVKGVVLVGIKPTFAATGFGYISSGEGGRVLSFREKPDRETAEEYIQKGFLWNAGIFVCTAGALLELFREHAPDLFEGLMEIKRTGNVEGLYPSLRRISFDFAVMEKAKNALCVPADFSWNDIGSFATIAEVRKEGNVVLGGDLVETNSHKNIVYSSKGKKICLVDCEDLVIVDTQDVLLVCPKSASNRIKKFVEDSVPEGLH